MTRILIFFTVVLGSVVFLTFCEREDIFELSTAPQKIYLFTNNSATYDGNIGGLAGGDTECKTIKDSTYPDLNVKNVIIFASDETTNLKDRIPGNAPVYAYTGAVENLVSPTTSGLWDGTLDATLLTTLGLNGPWWSHTLSSGTANTGNTCNSFTDNAAGTSGTPGGFNVSNSTWIHDTTETCDATKRIICAGW